MIIRNKNDTGILTCLKKEKPDRNPARFLSNILYEKPKTNVASLMRV
jgi:hypothetical protein